MSLNELMARAGVSSFFPWQYEVFHTAGAWEPSERQLCLFYRTGAGKSLTALILLALWGQEEAVVIAPPSTHEAWQEQAQLLGLEILTISHAKFRQKSFKLSRTTAVVVDEFHLLGGHKGQGWKKMDRLARGLQAPLILASATPNYNDAERVYCIQHVLDPRSIQGGYIEWIYQHCTTKQNPFGIEPEVTGFHLYMDAASFLAAMPKVFYLPDDASYTIEDVIFDYEVPLQFHEYNYDSRRGRIMASQIEKKHRTVDWAYLKSDGELLQAPAETLLNIRIRSTDPSLVFAVHTEVAKALAVELGKQVGFNNVRLITGSTPPKLKQEILDEFRAGDLRALVGTASLATGTDGLDKVCDTLIIVDDTEDDALRRQLIGRILPRGATPAGGNSKRIFRMNPET